MKKDKCPCKKTSIGGQALMEGIMMRGPQKTAMAVRNPEGEIVLEVSNNSTKTPVIAKIPVVRGVFNFAMSMIQGYKCLMRSAEISGLEEAEEEMRREKEAKKAAKAAKKAAKKGEPVEASAEVQELSEQPVTEEIADQAAEVAETAETVETAETAETAETVETVETVETAAPAAPAKKEKKTDSASLTTTLVMVLGVVLGNRNSANDFNGSPVDYDWELQNGGVINANQITLPGYADLFFPAGQKQIEMILPNHKSNPCYLRYTLLLEGTGEILCQTPLIAPGKAVLEIELSRTLPVGDYYLIIAIDSISLADGRTPMNGAEHRVLLQVR